MAKRKNGIHPSIKECLGYPKEISDQEFLELWKNRSTQVCKPCWEIKYCPYGPFVEQSPLLPTLRKAAVSHNEYLKKVVETNVFGSQNEINEERREVLKELLALAENDFLGFIGHVAGEYYFELSVKQAGEEGKGIFEALSGRLPPIEKYKVPFPLEHEETGIKQIQLDEVDPELIAYAKERKSSLVMSLETGIEDNRRPLDKARKLDFGRDIESFDAEAHPDSIPEAILDTQCNIFGHICPVVFVGESITETAEMRRRGRYISFATKMRVVRRDNHTCQECGKHLKDDEVEFDHIIPVAKGGSSEEHNIRLTCFGCNREKSDKVQM